MKKIAKLKKVNPEKKLYDKIYADPAVHTEYGHTNHGKEWVDFVRTFEDEYPISWLDVGCGYNELIKSIRDRKSIFKIKDSWGIDFSCPGADQNCDILDLPFPDKRWDFITAFDVLEHFLSEQVPFALMEMSRVSKRFAFTISFKEARLEIDGKNVHPTVWTSSAWTKEIEKASGSISYISSPSEGFFIGKWK